MTARSMSQADASNEGSDCAFFVTQSWKIFYIFDKVLHKLAIMQYIVRLYIK